MESFEAKQNRAVLEDNLIFKRANAKDEDRPGTIQEFVSSVLQRVEDASTCSAQNRQHTTLARHQTTAAP